MVGAFTLERSMNLPITGSATTTTTSSSSSSSSSSTLQQVQQEQEQKQQQRQQQQQQKIFGKEEGNSVPLHWWKKTSPRSHDARSNSTTSGKRRRRRRSDRTRPDGNDGKMLHTCRNPRFQYRWQCVSNHIDAVAVGSNPSFPIMRPSQHRNHRLKSILRWRHCR